MFQKFQFLPAYLTAGLAMLCLVTQGLLAGTINGSFTRIEPGDNIELSVLGKRDWVHWGLFTAESITRKSGVATLLSNYSLIGRGSVVVYQYADNYNGYTWVDGWPSPSMTNTTTGVWAYQSNPTHATGTGFQVNAPADNKHRTLHIFVGAFAARGQFRASLSDRSAVDYSDSSLFNDANGPGGVYTINYQADSPGQVLTIEWTLLEPATGPNGATANVTLQAAALTDAEANNPPYTSLVEPLDQSVFSEPASIVLDASAHDFDGTITNVAFYSGTNLIKQLSAEPYTCTWSNVPVGRYFLRAVATDQGGSSSSSLPIEVFVTGRAGVLSGTEATPPTWVDLTTEGSADWAHWGLHDERSFNHKNGSVSRISNFTALGTNGVLSFADGYTAFSWADGTPDASTPGTTTGVFICGITNGFMVTAPADRTLRTLRIYVGGYAVQALFQAYLGDFSAAPYIDTSLISEFGNTYAVYTLNYATRTGCTNLVVVYRALRTFDEAYGNVTLAAATLQAGPSLPEPEPVQILNPKLVAGQFTFSFYARSNTYYSVEKAEALTPAAWTPISCVVGNGEVVELTNQVGTALEGYYRVRSQ